MNKKQEDLLAEEIWLNYFNDYLFRKEMISETQHNKMNVLIGRCSYAKRKGP